MRVLPWAAALVLVTCFLGACSSPQLEPLAQGPVVIPRVRPGSVGSRTQDERPELPGVEAMEVLEHARDLLDAQDYDRALETLNDLASKNPPRSFLENLQRMRMEVKRHLLQSVHVDALVVLDQKRVTLGSPITGELVLVNLSQETLVIPNTTRFLAPDRPARSVERRAGRTAPGTSVSTIVEKLDYREFVANGTLITQERNRNHLVGKDLVLAPGERVSWPIDVDSLAFSPGSVAVREYKFSATMFPAALRIGTESFPGTLTFKPAICHVFPRNYEGLLDDPLAKLSQVIVKQSPQHIPLAAALVPLAQRDKAVREIESYLMCRREITLAGPSRVACCVALRILTGWDLSADPELWIDNLKNKPPGFDRR